MFAFRALIRQKQKGPCPLLEISNFFLIPSCEIQNWLNPITAETQVTCKNTTQQVCRQHSCIKNEWSYASTPHLHAQSVDKYKRIPYIQEQNVYLSAGPGRLTVTDCTANGVQNFDFLCLQQTTTLWQVESPYMSR